MGAASAWERESFDAAWREWRPVRGTGRPAADEDPGRDQARGGIWLGAHLVEAEAGTWSRYVAVATPLLLSDDVAVLGGDVLVTLVYPHAGAHAMAADGDVHPAYVAEKFGPHGKWHPGDLAAVTRTIAAVLGRKAVYPHEGPESDVNNLLTNSQETRRSGT